MTTQFLFLFFYFILIFFSFLQNKQVYSIENNFLNYGPHQKTLLKEQTFMSKKTSKRH